MLRHMMLQICPVIAQFAFELFDGNVFCKMLTEVGSNIGNVITCRAFVTLFNRVFSFVAVQAAGISTLKITNVTFEFLGTQMNSVIMILQTQILSECSSANFAFILIF